MSSLLRRLFMGTSRLCDSRMLRRDSGRPACPAAMPVGTQAMQPPLWAVCGGRAVWAWPASCSARPDHLIRSPGQIKAGIVVSTLFSGAVFVRADARAGRRPRRTQPP